jgi:enterobacterial common antigen flippase
MSLYDRESLRRTAIRLSLATAGITTTVVIACNTFGLPAGKQYLWPLSVLCAASIFGQQIMLVVSAVDRGSGDFARYNRLRLFAAALFPASLLLWLVIAGKPTLVITCWLLTISSTISMVPCFFRFATGPGHEPAPQPKQMLREGRPYAVSMLATDLLDRIDLLLVLWLTSIVTQGYYNAMIPVAYPLTVIPNTLGLFLFNAGARGDGSLTAKRFNHILLSSIAVQTVMTIGFIALVGIVIRFVYGAEFAPAVPFALWMAPIAAVKGIVQGLESYVKGRGNPLATVRIRVISAFVMLLVILGLYPVTNVFAILQGALVGQVACLAGLVLLIYHDIKTQPVLEPGDANT